MDSPRDPEEPKSSIEEFVTNTTAALTKGTLKTEGSSQLSNDDKMVLSKESLPAAESLPTIREKEIVCSVSSSLHGSQKPTVNKITSKGSLVQVQESSSSSSGLLSSASRVLSEVLKSWWNLKPKEFDSSAPQQLTPSQPQSFAPKALAEHDQPDEPKRRSFLDEINNISSGDEFAESYYS